MKKKEKSFFRMAKTTETLLTDRLAVLSADPAVMALRMELRANLAESDEVLDLQTTGSKGATKQKASIEVQLIHSTMRGTGYLRMVAETEGLEMVKPLTELSESDLNQKSSEELLSFGRVISGLLYDHIDSLTEAGLSAGQIDAYDSLVADFAEWEQKPRAVVSQRSAGTQSLKPLRKKVRSLLKYRLDRIMRNYIFSHPDLYAAYLNARKIVDMGSKKKDSGE